MTNAERQRARKKRCRDGHLCTVCARRPPTPGYDLCAECRHKHGESHRLSRQRAKDECFEAYGGYVCSCCGERKHPDFMQIDHVAGNGKEDRQGPSPKKGVTLYRWLRAQNYPDGYQVLCVDCNFAKGDGEVCPHQEQNRSMLAALAAMPLTY